MIARKLYGEFWCSECQTLLDFVDVEADILARCPECGGESILEPVKLHSRSDETAPRNGASEKDGPSPTNDPSGDSAAFKTLEILLGAGRTYGMDQLNRGRRDVGVDPGAFWLYRRNSPGGQLYPIAECPTANPGYARELRSLLEFVSSLSGELHDERRAVISLAAEINELASERTELRAYAASTLPCPNCSAGPGEQCRTPAGDPSKQTHAARIVELERYLAKRGRRK